MFDLGTGPKGFSGVGLNIYSTLGALCTEKHI